MPDLLLLPNPAAPLVGPGGVVSPEWYAYLQALEERSETGAVTLPELEAAIAAIATALGSPDGTVAGIPENAGGISDVLGSKSVRVLIEGRARRVELQGDVQFPAIGQVYGVRPDGSRGFIDAGGDPQILPMVNGELPPVLMHDADGELIYYEV